MSIIIILNKETLISRLGKYRVVKRRWSIDVWEVHSGRWLGFAGKGPQYGVEEISMELHLHPNERFVISSDETGAAVSMEILKKNLECWKMNGIPPLNIRPLLLVGRIPCCQH